MATGATAAEASARIRRAITMHLEGMAEDGEPVPAPTTAVEYVEVAAPSPGAGPNQSPQQAGGA